MQSDNLRLKSDSFYFLLSVAADKKSIPNTENTEPDHTICCEQNCCPVRHIDSVLRVDIRVAMIISITVIIISITTGISLIICCFWSQCPLYDTCAGGYKRRDILPFGEYDGSDTDLLTSNGHAKHNPKYYATASNVKIKVTKADHV